MMQLREVTLIETNFETCNNIFLSYKKYLNYKSFNIIRTCHHTSILYLTYKYLSILLYVIQLFALLSIITVQYINKIPTDHKENIFRLTNIFPGMISLKKLYL